jgi:hypothetical protein
MSTRPVFSADGWNWGYTDQLWHLTNHQETFDVPIEPMEELLDTPHWDGHLSANDILSWPFSGVRHAIRIAWADLSFPILLLKGDLVMLDGMHRLAKAVSLGHKTIKVRFVDQDTVDLCFAFRD